MSRRQHLDSWWRIDFRKPRTPTAMGVGELVKLKVVVGGMGAASSSIPYSATSHVNDQTFQGWNTNVDRKGSRTLNSSRSRCSHQCLAPYLFITILYRIIIISQTSISQGLPIHVASPLLSSCESYTSHPNDGHLSACNHKGLALLFFREESWRGGYGISRAVSKSIRVSSKAVVAK